MNLETPTLTTPQAPPRPELYRAPSTNQGPKGLGGWLILVGINLIFSPFRIMGIEFELFELFSNGTWNELADSSSEFYNPGLAAIIPLEFVINMAFIFSFFFLIYLFFTQSSIFPRWFIGVFVANFAMIVLDLTAVYFVVPDAPIIDPETSGELMRSLGACAIWIPYMLKSKRVANTFVK